MIARINLSFESVPRILAVNLNFDLITIPWYSANSAIIYSAESDVLSTHCQPCCVSFSHKMLWTESTKTTLPKLIQPEVCRYRSKGIIMRPHASYLVNCICEVYVLFKVNISLFTLCPRYVFSLHDKLYYQFLNTWLW